MWIIYSLLCAFTDSIASLTNKKLMSKKQDPLVVSVFIHGLASIGFLVAAIFLGQNILKVSPTALIFIIITAIFGAAGGVVLLMSLQKGDLSLIAPIQTITPLLILIVAVFFLNETPRPIGLLGIILIIFGGIYLDKNPHEKLSSIMKRIVTYKPALLGVLAAIFYAMASVMDKFGLRNTTVVIWIFYVYFFIFLFILPIAIKQRKNEFRKILNHKTLLISSSFFSVIAIFFQLLAIQTTMVSYVLSIKRLSSVFAVILAYVFLSEKRALYRLRGAIVMVIGAILIGIS